MWLLGRVGKTGYIYVFFQSHSFIQYLLSLCTGKNKQHLQKYFRIWILEIFFSRVRKKKQNLICMFRTLCSRCFKKTWVRRESTRVMGVCWWVSRKDRLCRERDMRANLWVEEEQPEGPWGKDFSGGGKSRDKATGTGVQVVCLRNGKSSMREENRWRWGREKRQVGQRNKQIGERNTQAGQKEEAYRPKG